MTPGPRHTARSGGMSHRVLPVLLALLVLTGPGGVFAGSNIYVCPDGKGRKHFTNTPDSTSCVPFRTGKPVSFTSFDTSSKPAWPSRSGVGNPFAYDREINYFAERYRIDANLIKAVIRAESDFNRHAVSRKGAQGLMQLMPDTARELRVTDPFNPRQNIDGGTRYLRTLLDMFDGDVVLALAAYNAGPTLVRKVRRVPFIPETRHYVKKVLAYYEGYGNGRLADASSDRSLINVRNLVTVQ